MYPKNKQQNNDESHGAETTPEEDQIIRDGSGDNETELDICLSNTDGAPKPINQPQIRTQMPQTFIQE